MKRKEVLVWVFGCILLVVSVAAASGVGAYAIDPLQLPGFLWQSLQAGKLPDVASGATTDMVVFMNIRLPRIVLGVAAGAGLAFSGAIMQGLFRNPLADPGLVGVSSGAALAAALMIVLGAAFFPELPRKLGSWTLVVMAFGGGLAVTALIYTLAQTPTGTHVALMLLAGIAVNALAGAVLGYLSYIAEDAQLRSLQFWMLGSLGGARWSAVLLVAGLTAVAILPGLWLMQPLNAIALGEAQAVMLGVDVENVKRMAIVLVAFIVGVSTSATGVIGFVGLVAPHMVRLLFGPNHKLVLPGSLFLGAAIVLLSDMLARTLASPAELPLGVLTALLGTPFFLMLLRKERAHLSI